MFRCVLAAVLSFVLTGAVAASEAADKCDRLAGYQWETKHGGRGVEWDRVDATPAIAACREALAESPDAPEIQFRLGRTLLQEHQYDEAIALLLRSAQAGYSAAQAAYGTAYSRGQGVRLDHDIAVEWLTKAAEQDNPVALNNLAGAHAYGLGVPVDKAKALELTARAAGLGYPLAMYNLAIDYEYGNGTAPDFAKAFEWHSKAVAAGEIMGYRGIARAYDRGQGVEADTKLGYEAWLDGAKGGDPVAQLQVALRHSRGRDVVQDDELAEAWMRRAAEQGYARAQFYLGQLLFSNGTEPAQFDEGVRWMEEAGARGELDAYMALADRYMGLGDLKPAREYAEVVKNAGNEMQQAHAQQILVMLQELELGADARRRSGRPFKSTSGQ